jgi:hypothetical protein
LGTAGSGRSKGAIVEYFNNLINSIQKEINQLNFMYSSVRGMFSLDPHDESMFGGIIRDLGGVTKTVASSLLVLFFLFELFQKCMDFGWVKIENVTVTCMKIFAAKSVVDRSDSIMKLIFSSFNGLGTITGGDKFPDATPQSILGDSYEQLQAHPGFLGISTTIKSFQLLPIFLILKLTMVGVMVMVIGRMFELVVYTIAAPLPLASFASSTTSDIGKGFIKKYAAVVLQTFVMVVMFNVVGAALSNTMLIPSGLSGELKMLLMALVLGLGILKSGTWAKGLVGAM